MNKILPPTFNDVDALERLANNERVASYPNLKNEVSKISLGYRQYLAANGNALEIKNVSISNRIKTILKGHYKSPPNDLKHITDLRYMSDSKGCPMCGSFHCGTLDHLLPQSDYPEFSIFSQNLVPACKCNSLRQNILIGPKLGERILHPYFDECLSQRLVKAYFEDFGEAPHVGVRLCINDTHPEYAAIAFHFQTIIERTSIKYYLGDRWSALCRKPNLIVRALQPPPQSYLALKEVLEEEIQLLDETHQSKNNWNSIFIAGLLEPPALNWLYQQFNSSKYKQEGSLI